MIEVGEAISRLAGAVATLGTIDLLGFDALHGLVLAETIVADRDFPSADRSAMDGFAVRSADAVAGTQLDVVGEVRAGQVPSDGVLGAGQAVRIMTGALIPAGADAVVPIEEVVEDRDAGRIFLHQVAEPGRHVRARATELARGATILEPGRRIDSVAVAALAAVGRMRVRVYADPVIHLLSTGDEVIEVSTAPAAHQVRNSNGPMLAAALAELGLGSRYLGIAGDDPRALRAIFERALDADVLIITGGVSVGEYDLVRQTLEAAGMVTLFHGVRMKPGKPILAGRVGRCLVVGLPGNPASAFVGFEVIVAPALRRMRGLVAWENSELTVRLTEPLRVPPGRTTFSLALVESQNGRLVARRVSSAGSGDVLALARANAVLVSPALGVELGAGDEAIAIVCGDPGR